MDNIPFARPFTGKEEEAAVIRVLRSGWFTTGQEALAFEKEFAAFFEAFPQEPSTPHGDAPLTALAVNSATSGLHLALEACGIRPGDVVLVPSYTFTSTAEVVRYLGADAVFVDVAPGTFHIDPKALEATLERLSQGLPAYTPRHGKNADGGHEGFGPQGQPKAVIPVHYGGLPCDMEAIMQIAARYGLKVIEDAAHSFPSRLKNGSWAGTIGDAGVFSFYATKTLTTGEGGMVVSGDPRITGRIAVMRSHGIDRNVWNRYTDTNASWYYEVVEAGYKYNLPDLLAAVGRVQLTRAFDLLDMRKEIARAYDDAFRGDAHFLLPPTGAGDARHLYPLRLNPEGLSLSRDAFIEKLKDAGIGVSVHFIPLHIMPYYRKRYNLLPEDFPESLKSFEQVISLPIWPGMKQAQVERVIAVVTALAAEHSRYWEGIF
ncbi:MAG: DegT/DnrJ/EryC1/StrS family aminotransferase [Treponema sp.]|jgi:dTDP-4-amino-4,6-dideoxygalactose transaminase|nr:DegT/DnrJ/EryC1/StrS family aminotransferase [Treponema sp.]